MAAFMITTLSCERDLFLMDEGSYNPIKVKLNIAFELPRQEEKAITRSIVENDEYKLNDFYLMVFAKKSADDANPECVYKQIFDPTGSEGQILDYHTFSTESGNWISAEQKYRYHEEQINTTSGFVTIEPEFDMKYGCYIYGFANVSPLLVHGTPDNSTLDAMAIDGNSLITPRQMLDRISTLDELKNMRVQVNKNPSDVYEVEGEDEKLTKKEVVDREDPNLLYSGQWSKWLTKQTGEDGKQHNVYDEAALKGFVSYDDLKSVQKGNVFDLRSIGMVYLRTTIAHIRFNLTFNEKLFSAFKPVSWQVVHVPLRSYFIDEIDSQDASIRPGNRRAVQNLHDEDDFGKTEPVTRMLHDEGKFSFDFYMMENLKNATSTDKIQEKLTDYPSVDWTKLRDYYNGFFGSTVDDNTTSWDAEKEGNYTPSKQELIYGGNDELIKYAKREMELKYPSDYSYDVDKRDKLILNDNKNLYNYKSKKYVYSEPKATYVIIKGRLLIREDRDPNDEELWLRNLLEPVYAANGSLSHVQPGDPIDLESGYADVVYTVHLGYTKESPGSSVYDSKDFSIFRNAEYTYNIYIKNINSIITNVEATLLKNANDPNVRYRVKPLPNAEGRLNLAMSKIYNTDAHFNQFNFMLEKEGLADFYFEIHTPWSDISSEQVKEDIAWMKAQFGANYGDFIANYKTDDRTQSVYEKYLNNPDFTWFHFSPAFDQRGMFDSQDDFRYNEDNYVKNRRTVKYAREINGEPNPNLWNLFDFMVQMDALTSTGDPVYNESVVKGSGESVADYIARVSEAIKERINSVLYGNPEGDKNTATTLFECEVSDDNGNYTYTRSENEAGKEQYTRVSGNALPFLLDIVTYQLHDIPGDKTAEEQWQFLYDNYNAGAQPGDPNYYFKFKKPLPVTKYDTNGDPIYEVEEDYVKYLKETDPLTFGDNNQIGPIRRMFYTAYLDEYFYDKAPFDEMPPYNNSNATNMNWSAPLWKHFVNQPSRYINFGYRGEGYASSVGTVYSSDEQSALMYSAITILQPSIQTFYSALSNETTYALGVEHYNETYDPRWKDELETISTKNLSHANGYYNTKKYVSGDDGAGIAGLWDRYVSEYVYEAHNPLNGVRNNVTMRSSTNLRLIDDADRKGSNGLDTRLAYLAGAVRMCMNRNRDENNDGKIDEDELKWYLPSSDQMDMISLCHYSLEDPLFDHNQFYDTSLADPVGHQRLPQDKYPQLRGENLFRFHYATSDYNIFAAEEFMNSSAYEFATKDYASHPYEMRCVRNLNADPAVNSLPENDDDVQIFTYRDDDRGRRTFTMNKVDSRSIRSTIYHGRELPSPHYLFSTDNLPYHKFQVATNNERLADIIDNLPYDAKSLKNVNNPDLNQSTPCQRYYENSTDEIGSWRAPNFAEVGLMLVELRIEMDTYSGVVPEYGIDPNDGSVLAKFFWSNNEYQPFSCTSWNFTGAWGRVMGVKWNSTGWDLYASDPTSWSNESASYEYGVSKAAANKFFLRCVRDLSENE